MIMADTWMVDVKQFEKKYEISVLKADNAHGRESYGWFGENKMLIAGGSAPLCDFVVAAHIKTAEELCYRLNKLSIHEACSTTIHLTYRCE